MKPLDAVSDSGRSRHLVPLAGVQLVGLACGLLGVRWASTLVPAEILGTYSLLISTHLFAVTVSHQGLVQYVQRTWTRETAGRAYARVLLRAATRPTLWLAAGLIGLLLLWHATTGPLAAAWWAWMVVVNLAAVIGHLAHAALQAEERYWGHFTLSAVNSITRSFLPLALATIGGATLPVLGGGFLLHTLLWALCAAVLLLPAWQRSGGPGAETSETPEQMIAAFLGVGLCGWIGVNAMRWFAAHLLTTEDTGYFMLAINISSLVPTAISLIGVGYTFPPLLAARRAGASVAALRRMTERNVALALLLGQGLLGLLSWCGPHLVGVLVDARYAPSMNWLLATGGALLATVSVAFFCNLLVACDRARLCLPLTAVSLGLRLLVLAALTCQGNTEAFRTGLALLTWPTVVLEAWLVRRWLAREFPASQPAATNGPPATHQ